MEMIPKVLQAIAGQDHLVYIYFHDGTVRLYDASPLLEKGGVFAPLRGRRHLPGTPHRSQRYGCLGFGRKPATQPPALTWTPCELYESCPVVEDPLKEAI